MTQHCAIRVQHLQQGYGKQIVLNDVSLEIPAGQTFALLGRNGAGKTTLIRTLLGLMPPKSGTVEVLGLNPAIQPIEVRRRIGYLAEDQAMYGWMTADELRRFLAPFYPTWDGRLAADLLDRFGVPRRTRIKYLSKGQNVRLGLVLALAHQSEIVVLDDPTLGLDPISRKQFNRDVIEFLQAEKRTVFYSSHLLYEVEAVADAVGILDRGHIVRMGNTEDLQREIKRVVLPAEAATGCPKPEKLLDVRNDGSHFLVTLDDSAPWIAALQASGVKHIVDDLSLDEIFEAFVIGKVDSWPGCTPVPAAMST
jgi:ABC-2 type transport system ATP-binding protein